MVYHTQNRYYNFYLCIGKISMKLELHLSFLYGSTILPECILIVCLIIILMLDLISKERDASLLYFISLMGLLISIGLLLFQWNEKPIINFSGNFQTNSFNKKISITYSTMFAIMHSSICRIYQTYKNAYD